MAIKINFNSSLLLLEKFLNQGNTKTIYLCEKQRIKLREDETKKKSKLKLVKLKIDSVKACLTAWNLLHISGFYKGRIIARKLKVDQTFYCEGKFTRTELSKLKNSEETLIHYFLEFETKNVSIYLESEAQIIKTKSYRIQGKTEMDIFNSLMRNFLTKKTKVLYLIGGFKQLKTSKLFCKEFKRIVTLERKDSLVAILAAVNNEKYESLLKKITSEKAKFVTDEEELKIAIEANNVKKLYFNWAFDFKGGILNKLECAQPVYFTNDLKNSYFSKGFLGVKYFNE